jgi:hypothetical protein
MYGLPQAGIIAQELPKECLTKHGYTQSKIIPCFTLVVDNFMVKYTNEQDA